MIRRKTLEQKTGHDRWLVSYADFITLLFAFFVVMYSISQVSEEKYRTLSETLNQTFTKEKSIAESLDNAANLAKLSDVVSDIKTDLEGFPIEGSVQMGANENWVEITLSSELLFSTGSAKPSDEALAVFSTLADTLIDYENEIQVIGHTDNIPIRNTEYKNNWALSSARAISIVNYFAYQGLRPERLSAVAYGEYRPIADNSTAQGRNENRRVVLRIASEAAPKPKSNVDGVLNQLEPREVQADPSIEVPPESTSNSNLAPPAGVIKPVRLKGGDLLFSSDPNLPRLREIEEQP